MRRHDAIHLSILLLKPCLLNDDTDLSYVCHEGLNGEEEFSFNFHLVLFDFNRVDRRQRFQWLFVRGSADPSLCVIILVCSLYRESGESILQSLR